MAQAVPVGPPAGAVDAPELIEADVRARLEAAWWQFEPMPAFANARNAAYAVRHWECWEVCEAAGHAAVARGASVSVALRAENVAWRKAFPAFWHEMHKDGTTPRQERVSKWNKMSEEQRWRNGRN
jgi:hypothetical protein